MYYSYKDRYACGSLHECCFIASLSPTCGTFLRLCLIFLGLVYLSDWHRQLPGHHCLQTWIALTSHLWPPLATFGHKTHFGEVNIFLNMGRWRVLGRPLKTRWCSWDMDGYGSISRPLWGTSASCASCRHLRQGSGWGCNKWAIWKVPITNCTFNARVNVVLKMYARVQLHVCVWCICWMCIYLYAHTKGW
jgi:hypothetical protein